MSFMCRLCSMLAFPQLSVWGILLSLCLSVSGQRWLFIVWCTVLFGGGFSFFGFQPTLAAIVPPTLEKIQNSFFFSLVFVPKAPDTQCMPFFYLFVVSSSPSPVGGENGAVHVIPWGAFSAGMPWARGGTAGGQVDQARVAGNCRGPRAAP